MPTTPYQRPFLKWAGGKYRLLEQIFAKLPPGRRLIEPFAGSGVVFLNSDYDHYLVNDVNPHLIELYATLREEGDDFIAYARRWFAPKYNQPDAYYRLRERFNATDNDRERAALLLYLNRHGYNGLVRYNSRGIFNVPFGRYTRPKFPEAEMRWFVEKAAHAEFRCEDFRTVMRKRARKGDVIYADPPYVPLSATSKFTSYHSGEFGPYEQEQLAREAEEAAARGIPVLISNHDDPTTRRLYGAAEIGPGFAVRRFISCKGDERGEVAELLALFAPKNSPR